jgi:hypothetical protein
LASRISALGDVVFTSAFFMLPVSSGTPPDPQGA